MVRLLFFVLFLSVICLKSFASYQYRPGHSLIDLYQLDVDVKERRAFNLAINDFSKLLMTNAASSLDHIDSLISSDTYSQQTKMVFTYFHAKALSGLSRFEKAQIELDSLMGERCC